MADSTTLPTALRFGLALSSNTSACSKTISSSLSTFVFFNAETSTKIVSPPHSSQTTPFSCNCVRAIVGLADGWSILLTATMIGTSAACA